MRMDDQGRRRLRAVIDERRETYLGWLKDACRQPSVAAQGHGMAEMAALCEKMLRGIGAEARQIATAGYPVVYGEIGAGERTLSFYDHYDVQPPDPLELWESPPFEPSIRDGTFYARGVADNKGNLVARIAAADAYIRAFGELPLRLKFIFEGEEEIGSPHMHAFAEAHAETIAADACIWEAGYCDTRGRRQFSLGLKGILYIELRARCATVDLHSSWAAIVPSATWHLQRALTALKDNEEHILIHDFYARCIPPTEADMAALRALEFDEEGRRALYGLPQFVNGLSGDALLAQLSFQPTCNIAGIWSGYSGPGLKTVLPHEAACKIDFRLVPDQDPLELFAKLRETLDAAGFEDIEAKLLAAEHPARTPIDHPFAQLVVEAARETYRHEPVVTPLSPGSGPMYPLCQMLGIPAVSLGVGNEDSRNHAPNENIHLRDFWLGIEHIAAIMGRFGGTSGGRFEEASGSRSGAKS